MDIKDTNIGGLWSTHYPKRRTDSRSLMYCVSIAHAVRNVAQNNTSDGRAGRLRDALKRINVGRDGQPWLDEGRVSQAVGALLRPKAVRLIEINQELTERLLLGTTVDGGRGVGSRAGSDCSVH